MCHNFFMKNSITFGAASRWASIGAGMAILLSGCATPTDRSFNHDFGEELPTKPEYCIKDEGEKHFTIVVHQGTPSTEADRVINLKEAATTIARAETQRLGWEKWHLDYIQERDQGWMHIVIAKVTRERYVEPTFPN